MRFFFTGSLLNLYTVTMQTSCSKPVAAKELPLVILCRQIFQRHLIKTGHIETRLF